MPAATPTLPDNHAARRESRPPLRARARGRRGLDCGVGNDPSASATGAQGTAVVRARPGHERAAEALVAKLGGTVHMRLKIIGGFSATLPAGAVAALRRSGAVLSVTPNLKLRPESSSYSAASYDPSTDGYSMSQITKLSGARDWWRAGYTGKGVDVALIDTGVSPVRACPAPASCSTGLTSRSSPRRRTSATSTPTGTERSWPA